MPHLQQRHNNQQSISSGRKITQDPASGIDYNAVASFIHEVDWNQLTSPPHLIHHLTLHPHPSRSIFHWKILHDLLVKHGITTPYAQIKRTGGCAHQEERTRDPVGTWGARTRDTVGACSQVRAHARGNGRSIGIIVSEWWGCHRARKEATDRRLVLLTLCLQLMRWGEATTSTSCLTAATCNYSTHSLSGA